MQVQKNQQENQQRNQQENQQKNMRSYLKGAAVAMELTAHLSFGTVMLVTGQLQCKTYESIQLLDGVR